MWRRRHALAAITVFCAAVASVQADSDTKPEPINAVVMLHDGRITSFTVRDEKTYEKNYQAGLKMYEKAREKYEKAKELFEKKNPELRYDRPAPVEPVYEKVSKQEKGRRYGIYRVEVDEDTFDYEVSFGYSDAALKAEVAAETAKAYNKWVRGGKKGDEPANPTVAKVSSGALETAQAKKGLVAMKAYQKKYQVWVRKGKPEGKEPVKPDLSKILGLKE